MGDPRSPIPGILRSIIDANRMSKMPSLPSRNCIYILLVRLFPVSISKTLWKRCTSSQNFLPNAGSDRRVNGAASSWLECDPFTECDETIYSKCLGVATQALVIRGSCILPKPISATEPLEAFLFSSSFLQALSNPLTSASKIQANVYY